jgi:ElaB/YqjD/DUF883 family membrane-anchored ribosome-binding protein
MKLTLCPSRSGRVYTRCLRGSPWLLALALTLVWSLAASAQTAATLTIADDALIPIPAPGHLAVAVAAGVVLALAFQIILTNLSVAAGLNVASAVTSDKPRDRDDDGGSVVQTINNAFGIWTLVTASVALFFASWLAVELSLSPTFLMASVLGLVIWGVFYIIMVLFETRMVSSLVGSMVSMATAGLRSAYNVTSSIFTKSPEDRVVDTAAKVATTVKEELFGDLEVDDISKRIQKYIDQIEPQQFTPTQIRREILKLLDEVELRAVTTHEGEFMDKDTIIAHLRRRGGIKPEQMESVASGLQDAIRQIKDESGSGKQNVDKVADAAMRSVGVPDDEAQTFKTKIADYLRAAGKEQLQPEAIKRDLERLFTDPKGGLESLKQRALSVERADIARVISQRSDMNEQEVNQWIDRIYGAFQQWTGRASGAAQQAGQSARSMQQNLVTARDSAGQKLAEYAYGLGAPHLDYEGIKNDMLRLFTDPQAGADALIRRLKSLDREKIKAILSSSSRISDEQAEQLVARIEAARDTVIQKSEQMKTEIERRMQEARREALHAADEARKTAGTAGWWAFGTAVASAVAAVLGGIVSMQT